MHLGVLASAESADTYAWGPSALAIISNSQLKQPNDTACAEILGYVHIRVDMYIALVFAVVVACVYIEIVVVSSFVQACNNMLQFHSAVHSMSIPGNQQSVREIDHAREITHEQVRRHLQVFVVSASCTLQESNVFERITR